MFFHIPLAEATQRHFGVLYENVRYVFTRLPKGLNLAPSEMQFFSSVTVQIVENRFPDVRWLVY